MNKNDQTGVGYRDRLFSTYHDTHIAHLNEDDARKLRWFEQYAALHYLPVLGPLDGRTTQVLEIGCNKGYLLKVFHDRGFRYLTGVDLSPDDIAYANGIVPAAELLCGDGRSFVSEHRSTFDLVIVKAVLEHWPKADVLPFLELVHESLRPEGQIVVDVPNMDWLFAGHERFMDFTHEIGFTRESLRQVLSQVFQDVTVYPVDHVNVSRRQRVQLRFARSVLGTLLRWAHPEGGANPIWSRSLVGVARRVTDAAE